MMRTSAQGRAMRFLGAVDLDLLEAMMEPLVDAPFFVKDATLRYVAANTAMARLCGRTQRGELYGKVSGEFFTPNQAVSFESMDASVLATGVGFRDVFVRSASTPAPPYWLLFTRTPLRAPDGAVLGIVGTARHFRETDATADTFRRLSLAIEAIRSRFAEPLEAIDLAGLMRTSVSQVHRYFFRYLGATPRDVQHRVRLEHAVRLLAGSDTIGAIAHLCGYADQSAFTRRIRQMTGQTPGQLRARLRERLAGR